jgi:hypothetical protein
MAAEIIWNRHQYPDAGKADIMKELSRALPHSFIYDAKSGNRIAITLKTPYADRDDANARLMQAAPKMLELLARAVDRGVFHVNEFRALIAEIGV